jgi:iron complex outermembrane receptor protein
MQTPTKSMLALIAAAAAGTLVAPGATAADAAEPAQLEEVVVTAERRAEDPQKMAVSIVALSAIDLQEKGVKNVADLQALVPSLTFTDSGNVKFINIRGVGINEGAPNQTDGVANYIDGAYVAREFTTDEAYFDLESVEVLRGPQGTYVGQNSTGGAIFINTKKPSLDGVNGYAKQTFGTFDERATEAAVNVPLSGTVAVRTAVLAESRNSFTTNYGPYGAGSLVPFDSQPGNLRRFAGRLGLLYKPNENVEFHLLYIDSTRRTDGIPSQHITAATYANPWQLNYDFRTSYNVDYQRTTGILDWQLTPGVKMHVVSSYQSTNQYTASDSDGGSPYVGGSTVQNAGIIPLHEWYHTNEVDLVSSNSGRFQWTAGIEELNYHQPFTDAIYTYNSPATTPPTPLNPNSGLFLNFHTFRKNYAGFGELSFELAPEWEVKLGGRYNHDNVGLEAGSYLTPPLPPPLGGPNGTVKVPAGPNIQSFTAYTGRAVVNWKPATHELVYFSASRGYKPGGWTPDIGGPVTPNNVYGAETVMNYELGWKATTLDNHLRTALDVFHMDYQGFQATVATDPRNPTTSVTKNVSGTKINGLEGQLDAVVGGFDLSLGFSVLDAKFGDLQIFEPANLFGPGSPAAATQINLNGRTIDYAPKLSGNIAAAYNFPLASGATLTPRIQWTYQGGQYTSFFDAPQQYLPAYALGSARLTYATKKWQMDGFVTNLIDRLYLSNTSGGTPATQNGTFGAPRQYGLSLQYSF